MTFTTITTIGGKYLYFVCPKWNLIFNDTKSFLNLLIPGTIKTVEGKHFHLNYDK